MFMSKIISIKIFKQRYSVQYKNSRYIIELVRIIYCTDKQNHSHTKSKPYTIKHN